MKKNEVVFVIDRSGSMCDLVSDTVGGFNSVLREQKENRDGEVLVSAVLFNQDRKVLYDRVKISHVKEMTNRDYMPAGCTALIDALGYSIKHIKNIHKYARREDLPEHTLFVVITDGLENASRDYSSDEVKKMINEQKKKYNWEFLFIAANIDAVETAKHYGIEKDYCYDYLSDSIGTKVLYKCVSEKILDTRKCLKNKKSSNACMKAISDDTAKRTKKNS